MHAPFSSIRPDWTIAISPNIQLHTWNIDIDTPDLHLPPRDALCSIRLVVSGDVRCVLDRQREIKIQSPSLCFVNPARERLEVQLLGGSNRLRIVGIDLLGDEQVGALPISIENVRKGFRCPHFNTCPALFHCAAKEPLVSLAMQMLVCPMQGTQREFYLSGLALQMLALVMDSVTADVPACDVKCNISPQDIARIDCVRCMLKERCDHPPSLGELARSVGISSRRLTILFRQGTGCGIPDFLQEHRLQQALYLLIHTKLQVAEIAHRIGYTPAHLTTLFKKRFGQSPSTLRGARH